MAENISVDVSRSDGAGPPEPAPRTRNTCPDCNSHYREDEMVANLRVCTNCGHHFPVHARERIRQLQEANPMLGTRGCRLGLQFPEIYEMQVRAIVRAAKAVEDRTGDAPLVEIMHPLVGFREELARLRELTERVAAEEPSVEHLCGTMIELPRAALRADEIAEVADFFSFGTNDLTQTTLGFSRDDAEGKFLTFYLEDGVLERNPFEVLDQDGVGDLMRIAVERGRGAKENLKLGICGEHGGEPASVAFCHELGLDYVSCSPFRVPLARLAAAQAVLAAQGSLYVAAGG